MERFGMVRIGAENLQIKRFRLVEVAVLVINECLLEQ